MLKCETCGEPESDNHTEFEDIGWMQRSGDPDDCGWRPCPMIKCETCGVVLGLPTAGGTKLAEATALRALEDIGAVLDHPPDGSEYHWLRVPPEPKWTGLPIPA